jgi:hypothetical protein
MVTVSIPGASEFSMGLSCRVSIASNRAASAQTYCHEFVTFAEKQFFRAKCVEPAADSYADHPIKLPSKMLLRSQHLKPNGLEPRDQKLDFNGESSGS